ncbi:DUF4263 domain-containing protein, partial [Candidatus Woesearchaeota archaeon]|nr:DUF4263 domain-containing protein [Candidatus Woesearchaeota archaeon]
MGAVAQSQATVHQSTRHLQDRFRLQDSEGLPTSQHIYSVRPRSFVVIGRSAEFTNDSGEHRQKVAACFERFRRDLVAPEVYTFD